MENDELAIRNSIEAVEEIMQFIEENYEGCDPKSIIFAMMTCTIRIVDNNLIYKTNGRERAIRYIIRHLEHLLENYERIKGEI
jgi:hemerythrin-like domain-containing protein